MDKQISKLYESTLYTLAYFRYLRSQSFNESINPILDKLTFTAFNQEEIVLKLLNENHLKMQIDLRLTQKIKLKWKTINSKKNLFRKASQGINYRIKELKKMTNEVGYPVIGTINLMLEEFIGLKNHYSL